MENGQRSGRLPALDGLRGICACLVTVFHMPVIGLIAGSAFISHSYLFVDFFFVLSGYVITRGYAHRLADGVSLRQFLLRRFSTIYPLYLLVLLAFGCGALVAGIVAPPAVPDPNSPETTYTFLICVAMLQCLVLYLPLVWNVPGWSVTTEFFAYVVGGGLMRFAPRARPALMALLGIGSLLVLLLTAPSIDVFDKRGVARCFYGFAVGSLALSGERAIGAGWAMLRDWRATAIEALATIGVVAFVIDAGQDRWSLLAPVVFAIAILLFAHGRGALSALLASRPLVRLGHWSYAIYISHFFIEWRLLRAALKAPVVARMADSLWFRDVLTIATVIGCVVVGAILTEWVQPPTQRLTETIGNYIGRACGWLMGRTATQPLDPLAARANLSTAAPAIAPAE